VKIKTNGPLNKARANNIARAIANNRKISFVSKMPVDTTQDKAQTRTFKTNSEIKIDRRSQK
jgi:PBP1b-binding outer membrane lipoprotein LpoB